MTGDLLEGKKFNNYTVLEWNREKGRWKCRCDCGTISLISSNELKKGLIKSCGCAVINRMIEKNKKIIGKEYCKLKCIDYFHGTRITAKILCICSCGNETKISPYKWGVTKSCGCINVIKQGNNYNPLKDVSGKRFEKLVAISWDKEKQKWLCKCDCGNECWARGRSLLKGYNKSCGCLRLTLAKSNADDLVGKKTFYLKCLSHFYVPELNKIKLKCKCKCGKIHIIDKGKWGIVKSCGCLEIGISGERVKNSLLTNKEADLIRKLYKSKSGFSLNVLANMFNICTKSIWNITRGKSYRESE